MSLGLDAVKAEGDQVPWLLLPQDGQRLDSRIAEDALARLREDTSAGCVAVAPQRAVALAGTPRLAWWRIDPRTGDTTAVADDGLHPTATSYSVHNSKEKGKVRVSVRYVSGPVDSPVRVMVKTFEVGVKEAADFV